MTKIGYCILDGNPVVYLDSGNAITEAWWFAMDDWRPVHPADVSMNCGIVTKAAFEKRFPNLPQLPTTAFQDAGKLDRAAP